MGNPVKRENRGNISLAETLKGLEVFYRPEGETRFVMTHGLPAPAEGHRVWLERQYPAWAERLHEHGVTPATFDIIGRIGKEGNYHLRFELITSGILGRPGVANERLCAAIADQVKKELALQAIELLGLDRIKYPLFAAGHPDLYGIFWFHEVLSDPGLEIYDSREFGGLLNDLISGYDLPLAELSVLEPEARYRSKNRTLRAVWNRDVGETVRRTLARSLTTLVDDCARRHSIPDCTLYYEFA